MPNLFIPTPQRQVGNRARWPSLKFSWSIHAVALAYDCSELENDCPLGRKLLEQGELPTRDQLG
jgi:hypothetical protein